MGESSIKNLSLKKQFNLFFLLVVMLTITLCAITYFLIYIMISNNILLSSNFFEKKASILREYVQKNSDTILDKQYKPNLDEIVPSNGVSYEIRQLDGTIIYSNSNINLLQSKFTPAKTEMNLTKYSGEVVKQIPIFVGSNINGFLIIKYYLKLSTLNPRFDFIASFINTFSFVCPIVYTILSAVIVSKFFSKSLIIPIRALIEASCNIQKQNLNFTINYKSSNELGLLCSAFESMRLELKNSLLKQWQIEDERRQMISAISHDLRTPLTIIKGYSDALLEKHEVDPGTLNKYLHSIKNNTENIIKLVEDMNTLYSIDSTEFTLRLVPTEIIDYINIKSEDLKLLAQNKNISLDIDIIDKRKIRKLIPLDPLRFSQVLDNIVTNSIRFTPANGTIIINVQLLEDEINICIKDTGTGFLESDLESQDIFKKFHQGNNTSNDRKNHLGIGLYISKLIINKHNGTIFAKNNQDKGACIEIRLFP